MESHLSIGWCERFRSSWHILNSKISILHRFVFAVARCTLVGARSTAQLRIGRFKFQQHALATRHTGDSQERQNVHQNVFAFGLHTMRDCHVVHSAVVRGLVSCTKQGIPRIRKSLPYSRMEWRAGAVLLTAPSCLGMACRTAHAECTINNASRRLNPMEIRNEFVNALHFGAHTYWISAPKSIINFWRQFRRTLEFRTFTTNDDAWWPFAQEAHRHVNAISRREMCSVCFYIGNLRTACIARPTFEPMCTHRLCFMATHSILFESCRWGVLV